MFHLNGPSRLALNIGLFNAVRMMIGAINAVYLIAGGLSLSDLVFLQAVFSATVLLFEFPSGVLADLWSRKWVVVTGTLLCGLFYILLLGAPNLFLLVVAEIAYGIGLCLISGAFEAWVASARRDGDMPFSHYAHLWTEFSAIGSMITGAIGVWVVFWQSSYVAIYVASALLMIVVAAVFVSVDDHHHKKRKSPDPHWLAAFFDHSGLSLRQLFQLNDGRFYLAVTIVFIGSMQVIYHFWQPLMLGDVPSNVLATGLSFEQAAILSGTFIGIFSAQYLANRIVRKFCRESEYVTLAPLIGLVASLMVIGTIVSVSTEYRFAAILTFSCMHGLCSTAEIISNAKFVAKVPSDHLSAMFSAASLAGRIGALASLGVTWLLSSVVDVAILFVIPAVGFLLWTVLFWVWNTTEGRHVVLQGEE